MASSFNTSGTSGSGNSNTTGTSTTSGTSGSTGGVRDELRDDAKSLAGTARQRLEGEVDARKGSAVSQVQSLSSALGETADKLSDDTPSWLRSALEQGAQSLDQFAQSIEQKDARSLGRDAQRLARENPGTFLAVSTLAGFVAARIFKVGGSTSESDYASPGSGSDIGQQSSGGDSATNRPSYVPEAM